MIIPFDKPPKNTSISKSVDVAERPPALWRNEQGFLTHWQRHEVNPLVQATQIRLCTLVHIGTATDKKEELATALWKRHIDICA